MVKGLAHGSTRAVLSLDTGRRNPQAIQWDPLDLIWTSISDSVPILLEKEPGPKLVERTSKLEDGTWRRSTCWWSMVMRIHGNGRVFLNHKATSSPESPTVQTAHIVLSFIHHQLQTHRNSKRLETSNILPSNNGSKNTGETTSPISWVNCCKQLYPQNEQMIWWTQYFWYFFDNVANL